MRATKFEDIVKHNTENIKENMNSIGYNNFIPIFSKAFAWLPIPLNVSITLNIHVPLFLLYLILYQISILITRV